MLLGEGMPRGGTMTSHRPDGFIQVSQEKKERTFKAKGTTRLKACGESVACLSPLSSLVWHEDRAEGGKSGHTKLER